jgi:hypothetical protein
MFFVLLELSPSDDGTHPIDDQKTAADLAFRAFISLVAKKQQGSSENENCPEKRPHLSKNAAFQNSVSC